jgi:hypothetical protein
MVKMDDDGDDEAAGLEVLNEKGGGGEGRGMMLLRE